MRNIYIIVCCFLVNAGPVSAAKNVSGQKTDSPPVIDGVLDDKVWTTAQWYGDFSLLGASGKPEANTEFAITYDQDFIFVAVRNQEPTGRIKAEGKNRDAHEIYGDDSVEIFIAPGDQRVDYYQFQVSAGGAIADTIGRQSGTVRETGWRSEAQAAARSGEKEWTVEIAIPLADLEMSEIKGNKWGINIARVRRANGMELQTFIPMTSSFHQPAQFGELDLPALELENRRFQVATLAPFSVFQADDSLKVKSKISVHNLSPAIIPVLIKVSFHSRKNVEPELRADILNPAASRSYDIELNSPELGINHAVLEVFDRRNPGRPLVRRIQEVNLVFNPLEMVLHEPAYMKAIFPTQKISGIEGSLNIAISEKEISAFSAAITLYTEDKKASIAQQHFDSMQSGMLFHLPVPELKEGSYILQVKLTDSNSGKVYNSEHVIRKLAPPPGGIEWRINRKGVLLRDGKPFFPVGWFSIREHDLSEQGGIYNVAWHYWGPWESVDVLRERLDELHAAGGYAVIYPTTGSKRPEQITKGPLGQEDELGLRERVRALRDHPGLLAWYLADEPEYHNVLPEAVIHMRSVIAEEDPYHPTIVVNNTFGAIQHYSGTADIIAPDPYPFFKRDGDSPAMSKVAAFISEAKKVAGPGQAVWAIPQAHDTRDFGGLGERAPNFLESRNMAWQSIIHGAQGIVWWSWSHINPNVVDSVLGNAYLAKEMDALKKYIFAEEANNYSIKPANDKNILVSRRVVEGNEAILIANTATTPRSFTLSLPSLRGKLLHPVGEQREIKVDNEGTLDVTLDKYGVLLLTTTSVELNESVGQVTEAISRELASRLHEGNLAHENKGTLAAVSSRGRYKPGPIWMLDGLRTGRAWQGADFKKEDVITLSWPEVQRIGRLKIYTETIRNVRVETIKAGSSPDNWQIVAELNDAREDVCEIKFKTVETAQLRLIITGIRPGTKANKIYEIEAYEN